MDSNRPKPTALIVDDDRAIQRLLADALAKEGFSVFLEKDGEWGLKTFEEKHIDVVLLDLLLPALHGFEVARRIRLLPKGQKVPIIFISGVYKSAQHQADAQKAYGIVGFLEKPLHLATLKEILKQALGASYPRSEDEQKRRAQLDEKPSENFADEQARQEVASVERAARNNAIETIQGEFASQPFPEVLAEVYRWRANGALLLRREKIKKIAYFQDGRPFSIKSNLLSECLGKLMVREKMITEADCEESLRRMKDSGRQQGTVLIEMGCINPNNLVYGLSLQLQTKLYDIFSWVSGEYQFNPHAEIPSEINTLDLPPSQIIYEGVKRTYTEERVRKTMGDVELFFVHPARFPLQRFQEAGLDEEENALMCAINGHKTVGTLVAMSILPPQGTLMFLYAMRCSQMIEFKKEAAEGPVESSFARALLSHPIPTKVVGFSSKKNTFSSPEAISIQRHPQKSASSKDIKLEHMAPLLSEIPNIGSSEERELREHLTAVAASLKKKDYFQILGVAPNAAKKEIEQAYLRLTKEHHPDRHFESRSAEVRKLAIEIFKLITLAHDTLADDSDRQRYLSETAQGAPKESVDEISKILAAEGKFQKGEELLRKRQYREASKTFQEAVALYAEEGEFHSYLGWSLFQTDFRVNTETAIEHIEHGIRLNPKVDKSYLFLGYIHKSAGRPDRAEKQFEKALQCNPNCVEALRELRLLGVAKK